MWRQIFWQGKSFHLVAGSGFRLSTFVLPVLSYVESEKWKVKSGKWKVESGKWKVESGKWKVKLKISG